MIENPGAGRGRVPVRLDGVPETTLCTLYWRAIEARNGRGGFADPKAIEVVETLDYPFTRRFGGAGTPGLSIGAQFVGARARTFDLVVRDAMAAGATSVVALGEGLETQFWRVDDGRVRWLTVELPETAAVRADALGEDPPRRRIHAGSALDRDWLDAVGDAPGERVVIVAQGLLMYLPPQGVRTLLVRCAARFRGGTLVFDTVPRWFSTLANRGWLRSPTGYVAPPMPWAMDAGRLEPIRALHPDIAAVDWVAPPRGSGRLYDVWGAFARRTPGVRESQFSVVRVRFR